MRNLLKLAAAAAFLLLPSSMLAVGNPVVSIVPASATAAIGDLISVDVVIDSDDLKLAGYSFAVGLSQNGNTVGLITDGAATLVPLGASFSRIFGAPVISDAGFTGLNQTSFVIGDEAGPGAFTVETLTFRATANGELVITPFFNLGDSLGIEGGSCPPGVGAATCDVTFVSGSVTVGVPEPMAALLLGGAGLALLAVRRRS